MALNPGIVKIVELLNSMGYKTTDSGDGETHEHSCDRDVGYVVVILKLGQGLEAAADVIHAELKKRGADFTAEGGPMIQANYSPLDGYRVVDIHGIHDRMLVWSDSSPGNPGGVVEAQS